MSRHRKFCATHWCEYFAELGCPRCNDPPEYDPAEVLPPPKDNPLDVQVGGDHYKKMKIQPVVFIMANNLGFCEGNVVKYVCRQKGARLQDLKKARHYLDILIADEEAGARDGD